MKLYCKSVLGVMLVHSHTVCRNEDIYMYVLMTEFFVKLQLQFYTRAKMNVHIKIQQRNVGWSSQCTQRLKMIDEMDQ